MSCSSGRVGVGYERDTCNFICNTGYELTGSDIRTCQSDGSWSGSGTVCTKGTVIKMYSRVSKQRKCTPFDKTSQYLLDSY